MLLDSSQKANPILTLYLSTLEGFDENTKLIQKTKTRLKDFFKTNFCKYVSEVFIFAKQNYKNQVMFQETRVLEM